MAHNYTDLDAAILAVIDNAPVTFLVVSREVAPQSEKLAAHDLAPAWRIVDRRLQAMRKIGKIRYQRKPEGWVLVEA